MAPNQPGGNSLRIGVASCADQQKPQPIWDAALQERCGFFAFAGDNVYASEPPFEIAKLRQAYADLAVKDNFERSRRTTPHLAVWDDHDCGLNDGALVTVPHYGVSDIDFGARRLTLALRGIDNRAVHAHAIGFDELGIPS